MSEADRQVTQALQLLRRGDAAGAERLVHTVLERDGAHGGALMLIGMIEAGRGNLEEAALHFEGAIVVQPQRPDAHFNLGLVRRGQGRYDDAVGCFERALALDPANEGARLELADTLLTAQRPREALAVLDDALARISRAELWHKRGFALHALEDFEGALASYRKAIALNPNQADAHNSAGVALTSLGRYDEAIETLTAGVKLDPAFAIAWGSRAVAYLHLGNEDKARADFLKAIELDPNDARMLSNYGDFLNRFDRNAEAEAVLRRALELGGPLAPTLVLGHVQVDLGRYDEAMASYERAVMLAPGEPFALWCRALLNLRLGNLEDGFRDFEQRLRGAITGADRGLPGPEWRGAAASVSDADRTLFVYGEQGLGDTIQFARYVPKLVERGHEVIFEVQPPLVALMRSLDARASVMAAGDALPRYDAHCSLASLPAKFGTTLATIPAHVPYLHAEAAAQGRWAERCVDLKRPRVGLCWSGSPTHERDRRRSIPLEALGALIAGSGATFVSLQKDPRVADDAELARQPRLANLTADLTDMNETAALIAELDLVITVDTSIAHLAGAMARPVWVLLPYVPDWRWLLEREDSPWYPTARLFRQPKLGDWSSVITRVASELKTSFPA